MTAETGMNRAARAVVVLALGLQAGGAGRVWAHGIGETGSLAVPAAPPASFWSFLSGSARAAANVTVNEAEGHRYIGADGLPDHATGQFPNRGNPNAIRAQSYRFRVPLRPERAAQSTPLPRQPFGVALNGVPFDPLTAEFWNNDPGSGWNIEAMSGAMDLGLDLSNAHVQPNGAYHYHALPVGLIERFPYRDRPVLVGYAADGFPIYGPFGYREVRNPAGPVAELRSGYRLKEGARPSGPGGRHDGTYVEDYEYRAGAGDLDACNGRDGVTPEYPRGTYHYVLTAAFPFIPRCFTGTPDPSFARRGPPGGGRRPPGASPPR